MKILQSLGSVSRLAGGLFFSVRHLSQQLCALGAEVSVASLEDPCSAEDLPVWHPVQPQVFKPAWPRSFRFCREFRRAVLQSGADVLHTHGIWQYPSIVALDWKRHRRKPHVVSPRGMLEPWAWQHQAWKKRPVWWLWERRNLHSASVLHATAAQEAAQLRTLGFSQPIAIIPNGVELPKEQCGENRCRQQNVRTALFLSRIHPKKGLLNLVRAWRAVSPVGWKMIICGPDENGHVNEVRQAVAEAGLCGAFEFHEAVYGEAKERLLGSADLFVLPTYSENFGLVIAEALAASVPVITTTAAPWEELNQHQCGWWIDVGVDPLAAALKSAISLSDEQRRQMGWRGRQLIETRYTWPSIARQMKTVYEWALGAGAKPNCVLLR